MKDARDIDTSEAPKNRRTKDEWIMELRPWVAGMDQPTPFGMHCRFSLGDALLRINSEYRGLDIRLKFISAFGRPIDDVIEFAEVSRALNWQERDFILLSMVKLPHVKFTWEHARNAALRMRGRSRWESIVQVFDPEMTLPEVEHRLEVETTPVKPTND